MFGNAYDVIGNKFVDVMSISICGAAGRTTMNEHLIYFLSNYVHSLAHPIVYFSLFISFLLIIMIKKHRSNQNDVIQKKNPNICRCTRELTKNQINLTPTIARITWKKKNKKNALVADYGIFFSFACHIALEQFLLINCKLSNRPMCENHRMTRIINKNTSINTKELQWWM